MNDYKLYQKYLGELPEFLIKYLDVDIIKRLKDVSLFCGMEYASEHAYSFAYSVSRFAHSLNTAMITWNLTHSREATIAGLLHDVASPAFSHVIDYMNGDFVNQESTEEKTSEIIYSSIDLKKCLIEDNISIDKVINFKNYSIVDLERPSLCADRFDGTVTAGLTWCKSITFEEIRMMLDAMIVSTNENGVDEIAFTSYEAANYFKIVNDEVNKYTHTNDDTYMMLLTANMIKYAISIKILSYNDLYRYGERDVIDIILNNINYDKTLEEYWNLFTTIENIPLIEQPKIKNKVVNPLVRNVRIH